MRSKCLLVTALIMLVMPKHGYASTNNEFNIKCEIHLPDTNINVNFKPGVVSLDSSKNTMELSATQSNNGLQRDRSTTLGLTKAELSVSLSWHLNYIIDDHSGSSCARPVISITLGTTTQRVFIGSEFSEDSCPYKFILEHELRHVSANELYARQAAQKLKTQMQRWYANRVFYGDIDAINTKISNQLNNDWSPWVHRLFGLVQQEHANIDSPQEYKRSNYVCEGQIPARLRQERLKRNARQVRQMISQHITAKP